MEPGFYVAWILRDSGRETIESLAYPRGYPSIQEGKAVPYTNLEKADNAKRQIRQENPYVGRDLGILQVRKIDMVALGRELLICSKGISVSKKTRRELNAQYVSRVKNPMLGLAKRFGKNYVMSMGNSKNPDKKAFYDEYRHYENRLASINDIISWFEKNHAIALSKIKM